MIYANTWNLTGTDQQQQIVKQALDQIKFPWSRLLLPNKPVEIGWQNLNGQTLEGDSPVKKHQGGTIGIINGRKYTLGVFYTHTGRIYIDNLLINYPDMAKATVSAEIAHAVDYFLPLTSEQKKEIMALMHGGNYAEHGHTWWEKHDYSSEYYSLVGEAFMQAFTVGYSDIDFGNADDFDHQLAPSQAPALRKIIGVERTDMTTTTSTTTLATTTTTTLSTTTTTTAQSTTTSTTAGQSRYFAKKSSKVFHDSHKGYKPEVTFNSREEAIAAGYRPCKVCKP